MATEIIYSGEPVVINDKRCHLPITIKTKCDICDQQVSRDLDKNTLSYPAFNKPFKIHISHSIDDYEEEHTTYVTVMLRAQLEIMEVPGG